MKKVEGLGNKQSFVAFSSFSVLIIFFVGCLIGISVIPLLSIQLFPSDSNASLSVSCNIPNASPQVIDAEITSALESTLSRLKGIKRLTSVSGKGRASVMIDLEKYTDPDLFRFEAAAMLRQLYPKLPKDASYPQISLSQPKTDKDFGKSIIGYTLNGPGETNEIVKVAKGIFVPEMAKLKGLNKFSIDGENPEHILIATDSKKMDSYGVSFNEVLEDINSAVNKQDLGLIRLQIGKFNLSIEGGIKHEKDLLSYPIATKSGRIVRLSDIAEIKTEQVSSKSSYRINGNEVVALSFYPKQYINNLTLANQIKQTLKVLEKKLPKGYTLNFNYDNTERIKSELNKIYLRFLLSMFILLSFVTLLTRQLKYVLIIIFSLLCNMLLSFIFYYLFKLEIHLYSLAGITISLGMIIDNVIIIVEDIRLTGRNRIFSAILASTATTLAALIVIFLLKESQKINLLDFAIAIMINLIISLPIAYFFIPALLEKLPVIVNKNILLFKRKRKIFWFNSVYRKQLLFMLRFRKSFLMFFLLCFGLPLFMLPEKIESENFWAKNYNSVFGSNFYNQKLRILINKYLGGSLFLYFDNKSELSTEQENVLRTNLNINISMPNGATTDQMNRVCREFEIFLGQFKNQLDVFTLNISDANNAYFNILFKKGYESGFPYQLKQLLESKAMLSGAADFRVYGVGKGFSNEIDMDQHNSSIQLKGYNYNDLQQLAFRIKDTLETNPRIKNISITTAGRWDQKQYNEFVVDITKPDYLKIYGFNRRNISMSLHRLATSKSFIGNIDTYNYNILPVFLTKNYNSVPEKWQVANSPIAITDGTVLDLSVVSTIEEVKTGDNIVKEDQSYILNIHYHFIGASELNAMIKHKAVKDIRKILPFGYSILDEDNTSWWGIGSNHYYLWYILLVIVLIYIICAVLLESLKIPIAVIFMIPFSFIGVFLAFYLFNLQFDEGGYAALLMLSGIVTNAALYIINDLNFFRQSNMYERQPGIRLYIKAFNAKISPILVTTSSAILSMIPFLVIGEDKGFWFSLSLGTVGGLLFSIFGVYFLLPLCLIKKTKIMVKNHI